MAKSWNEFKALDLRAIAITMQVIASACFGAAVAAHAVLVLTGVSAA